MPFGSTRNTDRSLYIYRSVMGSIYPVAFSFFLGDARMLVRVVELAALMVIV